MSTQGRYELDWYFDTKADWETKPEAYDAIYNQNATDAQIQTTVESLSTFLERIDSRWSDGRKYVSGNDLTAGDFNLLAFYTSIVTNPGLYNPQVGLDLRTKLHSLSNVSRVIGNLETPMRSQIALLPTEGTWL